jgi:hypothetical protein
MLSLMQNEREGGVLGGEEREIERVTALRL